MPSPQAPLQEIPKQWWPMEMVTSSLTPAQLTDVARYVIRNQLVEESDDPRIAELVLMGRFVLTNESWAGKSQQEVTGVDPWLAHAMLDFMGDIEEQGKPVN